jgi:hypothetical protein
MTKIRLLALLAVVALVLFPAIAFAQGAPQMPCAFGGTVQVNGANVADGTVITATIGNETYTATTTNSIYRVVIAQPEGKSYEGLTATFMIGSATASQTGTWSMGGNVALDLTQGVPGTTPSNVGPKGDKGDTGPAGPDGATGPAGAAGEDGKDASSIIGIIAIVIAVIALLVAAMVMLRKPKAAA